MLRTCSAAPIRSTRNASPTAARNPGASGPAASGAPGDRMRHAERAVPENEKPADAGGDGQEDIGTARCGRQADLTVLRQCRKARHSCDERDDGVEHAERSD